MCVCIPFIIARYLMYDVAVCRPAWEGPYFEHVFISRALLKQGRVYFPRLSVGGGYGWLSGSHGLVIDNTEQVCTLQLSI